MLVRHAMVYFVGRGSAGVLSFVALATFTRLLGPAEYGIYAVVMGGVVLTNALVYQWLRLGVLRFLPVYKDQPQQFVATTGRVHVALTIGVLVVGAAAAIAAFTRSSVWPYVACAALLACAQGGFELHLEYARSTLAPVRYSLMNVLRAAITLAVGAFLVLHGYGVPGLLAGVAAGLMLPPLILSSSTNFARQWRAAADRPMLRDLLAYGVPLAAAYALSSSLAVSDRLMLTYLIGPSFSGQYAASFDLARQSLGMLMMTVTLAGYPLAVRALESKGVRAAAEQLQENGTALVAIALPAALGLMILADEFAGAVLGAEFRDAGATILPIIAAATLLEGVRLYYLEHALHLMRRTILQIQLAVVLVIVNLGANLLLIGRYGMIGAAYAALLTHAAGLGLTWYACRGLFPLRFPVAAVGRITVASLAMAVAVTALGSWLGSAWLLLKLAVAVTLYGLAALTFDIAGFRTECLNILRRRAAPSCAASRLA